MKTGWETKKLSNLYRIGSSKRVLKSQWKMSGVPFYRGREVTRLAADGFVDNELFISEEHYTELSNEYGVPKSGDIIVTAIGTIGNSHVVRDSDRFYFKDASVLWMHRTADVSSEFVNWWLKSPAFVDQLDRGNGATVDTLTIQKLQSVELRFPPLAEQLRIVGILDEAIERIATAKANADKNLANARALFESELNAVFSRRGVGWQERHLGDIAGFKNGLNFSQGSTGQLVRMVGVGDFGRNYIVPLEDLQSTTIDGVLDASYQLREGDLITVRSNGSKDLVGRCMLVPEIVEPISYSGFVIRIRPDTAVIYPRLLLHFMKSSATRLRLTGEGQGANISNINQGKLSALPLSVPPFEKQRSLSEDLDRLVEETERLEGIYQRKVEALDELKKSLLHEAFSGNL